ncbi:fosfomycin resistance glutathione transferase [Erwiniaceae bacterium BAC15a-03b]|uniref:Fosfomycin resistance glutathione transferase n=1 Tax=Winslowiella arboricola TaxID=2978220 RepID=A0A9J6PIX3_9GAMM|nr:fosfomycin resistance glutathione transferase [Winslowiella arboricola]MCU5771137.1 fosfomycin resistance glutathione transferase [Winslowiella arboricola]MCU5776427.1 fosfomycin resistance glutathione transferase [Winslowiella arboricola]
MLKNLNHLTLAVSDLSVSLDFYHSLLGLQRHATWENGAYLSCGDLWLCLSVDPLRRRLNAEESDYTHYAFTIDRQDFQPFVLRLEQAKIRIWKRNKSEGESCYFLDPDGHKLEVHVGGLQERLAACHQQPYAGMVFS